MIIVPDNPLMIGSLHRNQVRSPSQEGNCMLSSEPEYDPIGLGAERLLRPEFYGLRSTLAPEGLAKLDRHHKLLGKEEKTNAEQFELMDLRSRIP